MSWHVRAGILEKPIEVKREICRRQSNIKPEQYVQLKNEAIKFFHYSLFEQSQTRLIVYRCEKAAREMSLSIPPFVYIALRGG